MFCFKKCSTTSMFQHTSEKTIFLLLTTGFLFAVIVFQSVINFILTKPDISCCLGN